MVTQQHIRPFTNAPPQPTPPQQTHRTMAHPDRLLLLPLRPLHTSVEFHGHQRFPVVQLPPVPQPHAVSLTSRQIALLVCGLRQKSLTSENISFLRYDIFENWLFCYDLLNSNVPIYASFFIFIDSTQKFTMNIIMLIVKLLLTILLIYLNKLFPHINNEF